VEIVSQPVEPPVPPGPITLEGQDCSGAAKPATGLPGQIMQVVVAPGQALPVRICTDDKDFELACGKDKTTGNQIQTAYRNEAGGPVVLWRLDTVTGLPWTGNPATDLEACGGSGLESDDDDVCVAGQSLRRHTVKKDGKPTGDVYYTDSTGALVDIPADAIVVTGKCVTQCASIPIQACDGTIAGYAFDASSAAAAGATVALDDCYGANCGYIFASAGPGHTRAIYEGCAPDPEILVGYAADIGCATETVQESDPVDVCVDGVPATRWQVKENGVPTSVSHYTDANGVVFVPPAGAVITLGSCPAAACDPTISSAFGDALGALLPGHSISIQKPSCCMIEIVTSAGSFPVIKGLIAYSVPEFGCPVTVTAVNILSGNCTAADVVVTTQKTK
jgi:hypothetical protein